MKYSYFFIFFFIFNNVLAETDAGKLLNEIERNQKNIEKPQQFELPEEKEEDIVIEDVEDVDTFIVEKFIYQGNTLVTEEQLNKIFNPLLNKNISFADLKLALDEISILYEDLGLVGIGRLPSQDITEKELVIEIIEAKFGSVQFETLDETIVYNVNPYIVEDIILNKNKSGSSLNTKKLDEALLIASDLDGILVNQSLKPGKNPGETDTFVRIINQPKYSGLITYDNFGSNTTGHKRTLINNSFLSPTGIGDRFDLSILKTDEEYLKTNGSRYLSVNYQRPINNSGTKVSLNSSVLKYMVIEGDTKGQDLNGGSFSTKLDLTHPLIRSRTTTLRGNFGLEKKHFYNKQKDDFSSEYNTYNLFVGSNFEQNTNFIFGGVLSGFITTNFGYNDYTNSIQSFKDTKNFEKSENEHVKLNLNLNYTQFFNDKLTGIFKLNSQISESNLDSSQKLYLGGAEGVRAYPSSEGSGDNGILINNEIYMDINNNFTLGAFYDYGRVQQYVHNTPNSTTGLSLSGTNQNIYSLHGYGMKIDYNFKNLSANLTVAERLNKNPIRSAANLDSNGDDSRTQAWFQLNLSY